MRTIEIDRVTVAEARQRTTNKKSKDLESLKRGIASKGILHPPVLTSAFALVAGERRLLSMKELHTDGIQFSFEGEAVPNGHIPYTLVGELDAIDLMEAELEENVLRADLEWQEENAAKVAIHEARKLKNPNQRIIDTAQEIVSVKGNGSVSAEATYLSRAQTVMAHIHKPEIADSKNLNAAYRKVVDRQLATLNRELLAITPTASRHRILLGDCREIMSTLEKGYFDVIISDPPYGIKANKMAQERKHDYDDSPENAISIYKEILRQGFHLLKPQGVVFLFCDIEHFLSIRVVAEQQAFSTWRTPIVWNKGNEGFAPWGTNGFTRTTEFLLYAVKGEASLVHNPGADFKIIKRVGRDDKSHAAEKPPELLRWLLEISCRRDAKVLDPCCGSAPVIPAASGLGLEVTAIEQNEKTYETALLRLRNEEPPPESHVTPAFTLAGLNEKLGLAK